MMNTTVQDKLRTIKTLIDKNMPESAMALVDAVADQLAQIDADLSLKAPWLTLAHMICTDTGIEQGHITNRLHKLREKISAPAAQQSHVHCENCGCTWLDDGLNPVGCPYCKPAAQQNVQKKNKDEPVSGAVDERESFSVLGLAVQWGICTGPLLNGSLHADKSPVDRLIGFAHALLSHPAAPAQTAPLTDELIHDLEFGIAIAGRLYPDRAEAISKRLSEYRRLASQPTAAVAVSDDLPQLGYMTKRGAVYAGQHCDRSRGDIPLVDGGKARALLSHPAAPAVSEREQKLLSAFHVNMMRAFPEKSHDEISAEIERALSAPAAQEARKTWKTDGGYKCLNCGDILTKHEGQIYCPVVQEAEKPCGGRDYCSRMPLCGCGQSPLFPERDPSKSAEQQGLFRKFEVRRVDGSDHPGGKHHGCRYFVIDLDHDQHAPAAMRAYAEACKETHPHLSANLTAEFGAQDVSQVSGNGDMGEQPAKGEKE